MAKVCVVAGYGPGISASFSRKFGKEGFSLALLARTASRLKTGVAELKEAGISAKSYYIDLRDSSAIEATIAAVHQDLGPVSVLFWNPLSTLAPVLNITPEQLQSAFNFTFTGLMTAVQAAQEDLKAQKGAVLVTTGDLPLEVDMATRAANLALSTLAVSRTQRKLVHNMHEFFAPHGVYVAEVIVMGGVKQGELDHATIAPESVADDFWGLYTSRDPNTWIVKRE